MTKSILCKAKNRGWIKRVIEQKFIVIKVNTNPFCIKYVLVFCSMTDGQSKLYTPFIFSLFQNKEKGEGSLGFFARLGTYRGNPILSIYLFVTLKQRKRF